MKRYLLIYLTIAIAMPLYPQHLASPRSVSLGAFTAGTADLSALDWNPAGLVHIRDWEIRFSSFLESIGGNNLTGPFFNDGSIGKRISEYSAIGFRYAPGAYRKFSISTELLVPFEADDVPEFLRRRIEYSQAYSIGFARILHPTLAGGLSARYIQQRLADPEISGTDTLRIATEMHHAPFWTFDIGLMYEYDSRFVIGLAAKNLITVHEDEFPADFKNFGMNPQKYLRAGVLYKGLSGIRITVDGDTRGRIAIGNEWQLFEQAMLRGGFYGNLKTPSLPEALAAGIGVNLGSISFDASYLMFVDREFRERGTPVDALFQHRIEDIGYNHFTGNRFDLSFRLQLGMMHAQLVRIESVEIIGDVYPSSYEIHAYRPLAKVRVRNISQKPVETRVGFFVKSIMDRATETRSHYMLPGEVAEIPVIALFNETIRSVISYSIKTAEIYVKATAAPDYDDKRQTPLIVHGRNDWNGDILSLRYFVTPEDPQILRFTREALHNRREQEIGTTPGAGQFEKIRFLFDTFASRLLYVSDPRKTHNRVQYPAETLDIRGGDCDDMAVAFASILASVGIAAAFVDVIPPDRPQNAHVYLMIDSGLKPEEAHNISLNPKRYTVRRNEFGIETAWIPLETTAMGQGFERAWSIGAESFYNEAIISGGLVHGWVRIVDIPRM